RSAGHSRQDDVTTRAHDITGSLATRIELGTPVAQRLHKASKAPRRAGVYTHKDPDQLVRRLRGDRIHRAADLELYAIDRSLVGALAARLERRVAFSISIADREIYLSIGSETLTGTVRRLALDA